FFCEYVNGQSIRVEQTVRDWYHNPETYVDSHPAYTSDPVVNIEAPDVVYRNWGRYEFNVGLRESGGVWMRVDWIYFDNQWYTGDQFFGSSWLPAYGTLTRSVSLYRWQWWDTYVPFQVFRWNPNTNNWDYWTKTITLRP